MCTPFVFAQMTLSPIVTIERASMQPSSKIGSRTMSPPGGGVSPRRRSVPESEKIMIAFRSEARPLIGCVAGTKLFAVSQTVGSSTSENHRVFGSADEPARTKNDLYDVAYSPPGGVPPSELGAAEPSYVFGVA